MFWERVTIGEGCWVWNGPLHHNGYGQACVDGKTWRAHRYSWAIYNGPIPDGLLVLHQCDNRRCVNPAHLFLGTAKDNSEDMVSKGRQTDGANTPRGEDHYKSVLSQEQVAEIRNRLAAGEKQAALGREFGVTRQAIYRINKGLSWKE